MSNNQYNLKYTTDLNQGAVIVPLMMVFVYENHDAHVFTVKTTRDGRENKLTGASIHAYFTPVNSEKSVYFEGTVDDNGCAVVTLPAACYAVVGRFKLDIRAEIDGAESSIFIGEGYVAQSHTDVISDPGNVYPTIEALSKYGLGMQAQSLAALSDAHAVTVSGWYRLTASTANGINANAIVRAEAFANGSVFLHAYTTQMSNLYPVEMHKVCVGGVWGEWEWVNPALVLGVEYRTVERYMGKAVYQKLINFGALPAGTSKTVSFGAASARAIYCAITTSNGAYICGTSRDIDISSTAITVSTLRNNATVTNTVDMSGTTAIMHVKYTLD